MKPLDILITIDTEAWPHMPNWRQTGLRDDLDRDIEGLTAEGAYGIGYQMDVLNSYGLKGVFLVEALFACATGISPLKRIVGEIQERGHEVQLHIHPEWLNWMPHPLLGARRGRNMAEFTEDEQYVLIERALANLHAAGAHHISAFRAGNYGANHATIHALSRLGITYDTSYNFCYLDHDCGLHLPEPLVQATRLNGVWEIPISFFTDFPGHQRHAQLCSCSYREMRHALLQARSLGWRTFVIVSHSFELIRRSTSRPSPDSMIISRFHELCRFIASNKDKFRTAGFNDIAVDDYIIADSRIPVSPVPYTAMRIGEQIARRFGLRGAIGGKIENA